MLRLQKKETVRFMAMVERQEDGKTKISEKCVVRLL